jgi:hypothetical protein
MLVMAALALMAGPVVPWDSCSWTSPKVRCEAIEDVELISIDAAPRPTGRSNDKRVAGPNDVYFFVVEGTGVTVCADQKTCLRVRVPQFAHRPVRARWVNESVLYVEVSFNPRAGAFWLLDVEAGRVVHSRRCLDDLVRWLKCPQRRPSEP